MHYTSNMLKSGYLYLVLILTAISLGTAGCSKTQDQTAAPAAQPAGDTSQNTTQTAAQNAAPAAPAPTTQDDGNLPPVDSTAAAPAAPSTTTADTSSAAYQDVPEDVDTGQPPVYAAQAPPPLPEYTQPPCPGDNYEWTPGSWSYGDAGYYWVPGVWVMSPYVNALWTPPYWDFFGGRYRWHGGYWGPHIGFYGGVNYGFGYTGRGYYGGYWNGGSFAYNRTVTNVNVTIVHNVYERNVTYVTTNHVSYNGGPGGVRLRPTPAELVVLRETRTPPVANQSCARSSFE
jgi:hypothetical protein